jgi:hypothetical protein
MNDEETRQLEELWTRFVARQPLAAEERAALTAMMERDADLRRRLVYDLQFDGILRAAGEVERGQETVVAAVRALATAATHTEKIVAAVRSRLEAKAAARLVAGGAGIAGGATVTPLRRARVSRALVVGAVLLVGSAAALVLLRPRLDSARVPAGQIAQDDPGDGAAVRPTGRDRAAVRAPSFSTDRAATSRPDQRPGAPIVIGRLETVAGTVYRQGADGARRSATQLDLSPGDWVWTSGASARARLTDAGGHRIELEGDAVVGLTVDAAQPKGTRLFVAHGRATAFASTLAAGPALILSSPHASISGGGSVRVDVSTAFTRVEVKEGRARVSALGVQRSTEVEAGQFALVSGDDLQPPRARSGPRPVFLVIGPDDTKEGPPPAEGLRGSEQRLKARLEHLGFEVTVVDAETLTPERTRGVALLVLSSSVSSQLLAPWFTELPVPMLVLESTGFEQLGLTGGRWRHDTGPTGPLAEVSISNPGHPLAAGLTGTVRVVNMSMGMRWAAPPPGATVIASYAGAPEQAALVFGYERGAATATGIAPARRVGLFLGNGRVIRALSEQGWRLFDAAVAWAAGS